MPYFFSIDKKKPILKKKRTSSKKYNDDLFFFLFKKINKYDETNINILTYREIEEKTKMAEILSNVKFTKKDTILNTLLYDQFIDYYVVDLICYHYNLNIIIYNKLTYLQFCYNELPPICIDENYKETKNELYIDLLKINYKKPLKCMSGYKVCELKDYLSKLKICSSNKKKQELYEEYKYYIERIYKN